MNAFCRHCGKPIHEQALACPGCGGVQQTTVAPTVTATTLPDGPLWLPITSLVLGIIAAAPVLEDGEWDRYTTSGVAVLAVFGFLLSVVSIKKQKAGRGLAIAAVVLTSIALLGVLVQFID